MNRLKTNKTIEEIGNEGTGDISDIIKLANEGAVEWTNKDALDKLFQHDQSILGIPQVGDWPPALTPCDPIGIPQQLNYGWICPKCGRCLAPHIDSCPHCSTATTINITY
jgi:rubrerythrin